MKYYIYLILAVPLHLFFTNLIYGVEIVGFVEIDHISNFKNNDESKINSRNQEIFQTDFKLELNEKASAFSSVEFRADQSDSSRNRVYLDEAFINLYLENFDFRIGRQIITWGKADNVNPTDNITPWDYSDLLDTDGEKIGVLSLKLNYYIGNWTFEAIVVPIFYPSILPSENSRWYPEYPDYISNPQYPSLGPELLQASYNVQEADLPDENFNNAQFAEKISSSFLGWDISVSYYYGWNDLPNFRQTEDLDFTSGEIAIQLQPYYTQLMVFGGDFSTTMGKWGIRGEGAYFLTDDPKGENPEVDDPYFQYVLGLDLTLNDLFGNQNLFILIQWIHEIPKYDIEYRSDDLNHIFRKSIMARLEYEFPYTKLTIQGAYNIKSTDYFLQPGFTYNIAEGLTMYVYVDILHGKSDTFFGSYKNNKRAQVKVKYSF